MGLFEDACDKRTPAQRKRAARQAMQSAVNRAMAKIQNEYFHTYSRIPGSASDAEQKRLERTAFERALSARSTVIKRYRKEGVTFPKMKRRVLQ